MSRKTVVIIILLSALALFTNVRAANAINIRVEPQAVVVSELTPGGSAVIFGIAFESGESVPTRLRIATIVHDDDRDGVVRYQPQQGIPRIGIWGAVDFATGAAQLGSRRGYRLTPFAEPLETSLQPEAGSTNFSHFERSIASAEMLVVRPGVQAWTMTATEGGDNDADKATNGNLVVSFDQLTPLGSGGKSPANLQPGDVVIVIDADDMRAAVTTLSGRN